MKVFFDASLTGKKEYEQNYRKIVEIIKRLGHKYIENTLFSSTPESVARESSDGAVVWYKRLTQWVAQCDLAIFEVSHPSTGIGHELTMALDAGKPVIVLHVKGREPYILQCMNKEKLQVLEYSLDNLGNILEEAINYARELLESRFTLILDTRIRRYLDKVARGGTNRSEYIRKLIKADMERD